MIHRFKFRSTIVFFAFTLFYVIIATNLYFIQIKHNAFYRKCAEQQYHITITQMPARGTILDRTGHNYLAMNKDYVAAFLLPTQLSDKKRSLDFLKVHFPHAAQRFEQNKDKHFMFIKRRLSDEEIELITLENNPDIFLLSEPGRHYPFACASPLIGLTNIDNKGLLGLELLYDHILSGKASTFHLEKDARSGYYYFKKTTTIEGDVAHSLSLTIDADLQFLVQEAIQATVRKYNAKEAAAIIIDPTNGEIFAMVSYPYFDPNNTQKSRPEHFKNKIITDAYELGSVMKVYAALAALEEEVVTPDELIDCQNTLSTQIEGRTINTVQAHGIIPFTDVIAFSNNIGIAIVAKRLGTKLYDYYKQLGFGSKTGISFPGENAGFVNPPEKWSKQSIISLSYGYEISSTILQLASAMSIIATGYKIIPTLVKNTNNFKIAANRYENKKLFSDGARNTIKEILEKTTLYGTARRARIKGCRIMTKTGTANMLIDGKYNAKKNLYTCSGIVEKDNYQRVIVTFVKEIERENVFASTIAVPLFESIVERMLIHDKKIISEKGS